MIIDTVLNEYTPHIWITTKWSHDPKFVPRSELSPDPGNFDNEQLSHEYDHENVASISKFRKSIINSLFLLN